MSYGSWTKARLIERIGQLEGERSVSAAVLRLIDSLGELAPQMEVRAELALSLAAEVDSPTVVEGRSVPVAQVAKELRAVVAELESDDDESELDRELRRLTPS